MMERRIYVLYSERSGSNLLRVLLGNHSSISAPPPAHLLDAFAPHLESFGDLRREDNMARLLKAMVAYANHELSDWRLDADGRSILERHRPMTFVQAADAVYSEKAASEKKVAYVCKDNRLFEYVPLLAAGLPGIHLVYLYRDPRDVAASWLRHRLVFRTPLEAVRSWRKEQAICHELETAHGFQMFHLSYEELTGDTECSITRLLEFLSLPLEDSCFQTGGHYPEASRSVLWENLSKPILRNNTGRYRDTMSSVDVRAIEAVARKELDRLRYPVGNECESFPLWLRPYEVLDRMRGRVEAFRRKGLRRDLDRLLADRDILKKSLISPVTPTEVDEER